MTDEQFERLMGVLERIAQALQFPARSANVTVSGPMRCVACGVWYQGYHTCNYPSSYPSTLYSTTGSGSGSGG